MSGYVILDKERQKETFLQHKVVFVSSAGLGLGSQVNITTFEEILCSLTSSGSLAFHGLPPGAPLYDKSLPIIFSAQML